MSAWRFAAAHVQFTGVLEDWWEQHRNRYRSARSSDVPRLEREAEEFDRFLAALANVRRSDDPIVLLSTPPIAILLARPEILQLELGLWRGYFAAIRQERFLIALAVLRLDLAPSLLDQMLAIDASYHDKDWER